MTTGKLTNIKSLQMRAEDEYDDQTTLQALGGDDVMEITKDSTVKWSPEIDELDLSLGGFSAQAGEHIGDQVEFSLKLPIRAIVVTQALSELPKVHPVLTAMGLRREVRGPVRAGELVKDLTTSAVLGAGPYPIALGGPVLAGQTSIEAYSANGTLFETYADNGNGTLTGDQGGAGTVDYATGAVTITFDPAPGAGLTFKKSYTKGREFVEHIGVGNDTTTPALSALLRLPISAGAVSIQAGAQVGGADDLGALIGDFAAGTIDYLTGAFAAPEWGAAVANGTPIVATYIAQDTRYEIRYILDPCAGGSACARFYVHNTDCKSGKLIEVTGIRLTGSINATRRKRVQLEVSGKGLLQDVIPVDVLPTPGKITRGHIVHYKAECSIAAKGIKVRDRWTRTVAPAALTDTIPGKLHQSPTEGTVRLQIGKTGEVFRDQGGGALFGSKGGVGTVDYAGKTFSITPGVAPATEERIYVDFGYEETFVGTMLDYKALGNAFTLVEEEDACGDSGYSEISMDAGSPEFELMTKATDGSSWNERDIATSQAAIEHTITWQDPLDRANTVYASAVGRVGNGGVDISDSARAELTLKGRLGFGLPGETDPDDYLVDLSAPVFVLGFVTDKEAA